MCWRRLDYFAQITVDALILWYSLGRRTQLCAISVFCSRKEDDDVLPRVWEENPGGKYIL